MFENFHNEKMGMNKESHIPKVTMNKQDYIYLGWGIKKGAPNLPMHDASQSPEFP